MRRPPKFVHGFIDRHGKPRFYFRRSGFKAVPLPGLPWSADFITAYEQALAGQPLVVRNARVKHGSMRALAVSYFTSVAFNAMKAGSQRVRHRIIDAFCEQTDKDGQKCGDKSAATVQREHVVKLMAERADRRNQRMHCARLCAR